MTSRFASETFTSVDTQPLDVDGVPAGLALSLGHKLLFFTTEPELAAIDGGSFVSKELLRVRVRQLRAATRPRLRALA
jgi:hypothetical protein